MNIAGMMKRAFMPSVELKNVGEALAQATRAVEHDNFSLANTFYKDALTLSSNAGEKAQVIKHAHGKINAFKRDSFEMAADVAITGTKQALRGPMTQAQSDAIAKEIKPLSERLRFWNDGNAYSSHPIQAARLHHLLGKLP